MDPGARSEAKPDLEALTTLPPFEGHPQLWLLQRGNSEHGENVVVALSCAEVLESLERDRALAAEEFRGLLAFDLGELHGAALTFSDASALGGELLVFTASAEDSSGADGNGAILGSVVGTIDSGGNVKRLRTIDRRHKVEGVHAVLDTGVITMTLVCDQDDPHEPSPLLTATMRLEVGQS